MPAPALPPPDAPTRDALAAALADWPGEWTAAGITPVGVVSDPHGWPGRLEAVLDAFADLGIPRCRTVCLGDLVDYGPDAAGVIRIVRELQRCVVGNHDMTAVSIGAIFGATDMTEDEWEYLRTLTKADHHYHRLTPHDLFAAATATSRDDNGTDPFAWRHLLLIHDAPSAMRSGPGSAGNRIRRPEQALYEIDVMQRVSIDVCLYGHTHYPAIFHRPSDDAGPTVITEPGPAIEFEPGARYLINVGSTGVQRDESQLLRAGVLTPWWYSHLELPLPPGVP